MILPGKNKVFNGKILLFGEYTLFYGSNALIIPYSDFIARWNIPGANQNPLYGDALQSNRDLREFHEFLKKNDQLHRICKTDMERFQNDLERGLYLESNIPQGYGVGSSGALIAAFYDHYCHQEIYDIDGNSIDRLQLIFASLESFFHGTSSGMDPLSCYLGKPLLFQGRKKVSIVEIPQMDDKNSAIFLVNSATTSATGPLVRSFHSRMNDPKFSKMINESLIPLTNRCINDFLKGKLNELLEYAGQISYVQFREFKEMIPESLQTLWNYGLDRRDFYLKLCGSGGGGFFLGFTKNYSGVYELLTNMSISVRRVNF